MDIQLNFINNSNDTSNSQIVVFQKNVATNFNETAVAWQVIENCGVGDNHPFSFPMAMQVNAVDSWGNHTPRQCASNNQLFSLSKNGSGNTLGLSGPATSSSEVQVRNDLNQGAISASIYKDDKLLATKKSIAPGQKAVFEFKPTIWIGAVSEVVAGAVMDSAVIQDVNTELSLLGISSADIVMTGGGPGRSSAPISFRLENIVLA
jgi:hypothetical protein